MAVQINFEFKDMGAVNGLNNIVSNLHSLMEQSLDNAADDIKSDMKVRTPVASGALKQSIEINKKSLRREIGPSLEYGYYQERGISSQRRPPIEKIQKWAMIKGLGSSGGIAKAIALKIASSGYKAQEFVKKTYFWSVQRLEHWFGPLAEKIGMEYQRG